jgi:hypothetical protein
MAVKSPASTDVIGIMGSRLFVISKKIPTTVERFSTGNKSAKSLVEYATTITNTIAYPLVQGGLKLFTRGHVTTPTNYNVSIVSTVETMWSDMLCTCVVIKGFNTDKPGVAISTTQKSGITFSHTNEVFIRNTSQARAIANSYLAFFEKPRIQLEQVWDYDGTGPAPYESLQPFDVITINGGTQQWFVVGLAYSIVEQKATVKLLQVI